MGSEWRRRLAVPDVVGGVLTVVVCTFLFWQTKGLPRSSAIFPEMVLALGLILGSAMAIQGFVNSRTADTPARFFKNPLRFLLAIGLTMLYVLGITAIGFYTATTLLLPTVAILFGYRRPLAIAITTAAFVLSTYLLFGVAMDYRFPPEFFQRQQVSHHA